MLARCACRDRRLSHNIVLYTVVERAARVAPSRPLLEPTLGQGERGGSKALHISGQPDRFRCARCKTVVLELYFQALFFGLRTTPRSSSHRPHWADSGGVAWVPSEDYSPCHSEPPARPFQ